MPADPAFVRLQRPGLPASAGCWIVATPEVRRRLLALAVVVLAPALLPERAVAQSTASGSVRLVIRAEALVPGPLDEEAEAILWMAPESIEKTERLAALWASGNGEQALASWRAVVADEVEAQRLETEDQADAASRWIARRTVSLRSRSDYGSSAAPELLREEIREAARSAALSSMEAME